MYCPNCGIEMTDNVKFCPNCGGEVSFIRTHSKTGDKGNAPLLIGGICAALALVILMTCLAVSVLNSRQQAIMESGDKFSNEMKKKKWREDETLGTIDLNYKLPEPDGVQSEE